MYDDGCNWPCRPLDRSVQAQRSRGNQPACLRLMWCVLVPPQHLVHVLHGREMKSTLKMALREATTLSKSRRGGEESDGGEVCLALLIVSSPPLPPLQRPVRARKVVPLSRTGTMARSEAISAPQTGKDGCTLGRLEARSSCSVVLLWSHLTLPLPSSFSFLLCCSSACVCCDILHG